MSVARRRRRALLGLGACAAMAALSACGRSARLAEVQLPTLGTSKVVNLASCPNPKCLTIVVAPWCGYCRSATGLINELKRYLAGRGVPVRVVVGQDTPEAVIAYARDFGPETLLDPSGKLSVSGVPHFIVSDPKGRILKNTGGAPLGLAPPLDDVVLAKVAEVYGLP